MKKNTKKIFKVCSVVLLCLCVLFIAGIVLLCADSPLTLSELASIPINIGMFAIPALTAIWLVFLWITPPEKSVNRLSVIVFIAVVISVLSFFFFNR
ncbi:MAG: hypothetical protein IJF40_07645 [Clostridia bacterium]|nr:hypothetical protein [Clostridia bacterium]